MAIKYLHGLHAHLNLLGFVLMMLFGLTYRAWPRMQESTLAKVHYFLHTVCVAISMVLLYFLLIDPDQGPKIGPVMEIFLGGAYLGVLIFAYLFLTRAKD